MAKKTTRKGPARAAKSGAGRVAKASRSAKKKVANKKAAPKPMDPDAMMAAWQKAMTPSEGHRRLEPMVGSWRTRTTFIMAPGAPPETNEGSSEHRWVLGGRYLEQIYKGSSMGMPFEGIGYTGYDNIQKKYVGTWMDSFGTGFMHSSGVGRPRPDAMDFAASACDPSGGEMSFECKVRIQDNDHHTYEMWTRAPGGKRYRNVRVEYTRA